MSRRDLRDGILLSTGTLSVVPVPSPSSINRRSAGVAMAVAPVAILPVALVMGAVGWAGIELRLAAPAVAVAMIIVLALGSRALHLDGLSDVADALTASHDPERSLAVMKDSSAGPAGAAALVLTLGLQSAATFSLLTIESGPWLVAWAVCASRATLSIACTSGIEPASDSGLAISFVETVTRPVAATIWVAVTALSVALFAAFGLDWWCGLVMVGAGLLATAAVLHRSITRFGGVTGDVYGATIEISLAGMLLAATCAV